MRIVIPAEAGTQLKKGMPSQSDDVCSRGLGPGLRRDDVVVLISGTMLQIIRGGQASELTPAKRKRARLSPRPSPGFFRRYLKS
jgi:hypothetical protein